MEIFKLLKTNPLLSVSLALLLLFSGIVLFATEFSYNAIESASLWVRNYFGYFYLYLGLGCVLFLFAIALSPIGRIRLGSTDSRPEYSSWSWIAMLYSAGMGAGILLRAVQEPVFMQQHPPYSSTLSPDILALEFTFYQWGFTAWAFYGLFAMVIGYALFVKKKKVRVSASIEDSITNPLARNGIDIITILTTVFGLIAAIALGTAQIKGGINHLTGNDFGLGAMLLLAVFISLLAFYSAWQGVNKGIKVISQINILVALSLLLYIFFTSDMTAILGAFSKATIQYLIDFLPMSLAYGPYDPGMAFLTDWTFYYWAFWLAWAPFTGIFIARISKGRTLRQMVLGVLLVPSIGTFFWFSVFGTSAFQLIEGWGGYHSEFDSVFSSLFVFFGNYPMASALNIITLFLLIGFLVTSLDSAVFVLSMFTDQGRKTPAKSHRLLWSVFILLAIMALLWLSSSKPEIDILIVVQKVLIITSLPFALFMVVMTGIFLRNVLRKQ
ncbi:BCCT family transporter [Maribacter sp. ANRC-HE7]|uniref:BCCT family transporter n=1 Tax=Maribacter aquimaris TaxID=2737171 RepID=A0ABR7V375_9FLAO|nr:BCCT family transporter [Maribacter aquimaris]